MPDSSSNYRPPYPPKPRIETPLEVNRERLIQDVYAVQCDLALLATWLKTHPNPTIQYGVMEYLKVAQLTARYLMPDLGRH
ncbi:MAG: hypothetical protein H6975_05210 [Gammaproteobacteria bacterium]|nr:hypothetical protein [Gammaproteobacteria bacterium]